MLTQIWALLVSNFAIILGYEDMNILGIMGHLMSTNVPICNWMCQLSRDVASIVSRAIRFKHGRTLRLLNRAEWSLSRILLYSD